MLSKATQGLTQINLSARHQTQAGRATRVMRVKGITLAHRRRGPHKEREKVQRKPMQPISPRGLQIVNLRRLAPTHGKQKLIHHPQIRPRHRHLSNSQTRVNLINSHSLHQNKKMHTSSLMQRLGKTIHLCPTLLRHRANQQTRRPQPHLSHRMCKTHSTIC
jgi:hypothetical protein